MYNTSWFWEVYLFCEMSFNSGCKVRHLMINAGFVSFVILSVVTERPDFSPNYVSGEGGKMLEITWNEKESAKSLGLHSKPPITMSYTQPTRTRHQEETFCLQHLAPLEVYCKIDQIFICKQCANLEHQGHKTCYTLGSRVWHWIELQDIGDTNYVVSYLHCF